MVGVSSNSNVGLGIRGMGDLLLVRKSSSDAIKPDVLVVECKSRKFSGMKASDDNDNIRKSEDDKKRRKLQWQIKVYTDNAYLTFIEASSIEGRGYIDATNGKIVKRYMYDPRKSDVVQICPM